VLNIGKSFNAELIIQWLGFLIPNVQGNLLLKFLKNGGFSKNDNPGLQGFYLLDDGRVLLTYS
jgi:hypothetical protein